MPRLKTSNDLTLSNGSLSEPDPLHEAWTELTVAYNVVLRARLRELRAGGFHQWHIALIHLLHDHGEGLSITDIARLVGLRNHTISGVVMRAEKAGFVKRIPDVNDSRVVRVEATQKGKKAFARSLQCRQVIHNIMGSLNKKQKDCFLESLKVLRHQAEAELQRLSSNRRKPKKTIRHLTNET